MSEPRDGLVFLEDMLIAAEKIITYTQGLTSSDISINEEKTEAILYNLLVLGEAAKGIPENIRVRYQEIPWRFITGMRDKIIHQYWGINQIQIYKTVTEEIPQLISILKPILADVDNKGLKE
ncbi:MAG: DUF86 domain-containing protein [Methanospirillum sp.]|uniref:HepT-like ribonuclease domain-containing protein n=1 Tax=Methanospirillum sp. TaxID=45200 RepID=UPI00236A6F3E|nr:DUF86 domain-containing protein [Methanospirillum sp.]MDD1728561.1 DUF86 domain-containing protein [Methanospirillum sp.]